MTNLHLIEGQPRWRVFLVHYFAKMGGVLIHVEGYPLGSSRTLRAQPGEAMAAQAAEDSQGRN